MSPLETLIVLIILLIFGIVVLTICLIALTTGFTRTGRMSGGLYCITAPPSNGKSYVATSIAVEFMRQGRKVFSNYPIVYYDGINRYESLALTKDMLLKYNFNGSVIIIDEAHNWFWSRKFKEFTEEFKNWFSTLSQHEISLYYIVQHEDRVDTVINDCANLFGVIEKTEIPILEMPVFFIVTWWNKEIDMQFGRTNDKIEPFHQERIWFNKDIANSYDTKWFGTDKRPIYEGVKWTLWLKEEYGFDYQGNYDFSLIAQIKKRLMDEFNRLVYRRIEPMVTRGASFFAEVRNRFDRDEDEEKQDETVIEAAGGVPSGGRIISQEDIQEETEDKQDSEEK